MNRKDRQERQMFEGGLRYEHGTEASSLSFPNALIGNPDQGSVLDTRLQHAGMTEYFSAIVDVREHVLPSPTIPSTRARLEILIGVSQSTRKESEVPTRSDGGP